jgi:hypothetical protein
MVFFPPMALYYCLNLVKVNPVQVYGLSDRRLGKEPITKAHFDRYVPPELQFVAYYDAQDFETLGYFLTDFELSESVSELSGWDIYRWPRGPVPSNLLKKMLHKP